MLLPKQVWKDIKGYEISNVSMMLKKIDDDEKTTRTISTNGNYKTEAWFLTEDGLYEVYPNNTPIKITLNCQSF